MIRQDYINELRSHCEALRSGKDRIVEIDSRALSMLLQEIETSRLVLGLPPAGCRANGVEHERSHRSRLLGTAG